MKSILEQFAEQVMANASCAHWSKEYKQAMAEVECIRNTRCFIRGYRLGSLMLLEVLQGPHNPFEE